MVGDGLTVLRLHGISTKEVGLVSLTDTAREVADALALALEADETLPRPTSLHIGHTVNYAHLEAVGLDRARGVGRWALFAGTDVHVRLRSGPGLTTTIDFDDERTLTIESVLNVGDVFELGHRLGWQVEEDALSLTVPAARFAGAVFDDEFSREFA